MSKRILPLVMAVLTVIGTIGPVSLEGVARAASPNTLSYQGRLKDDAGVVVADGSYDFVFTLWTASSGGTADWTENQTLTVTDGYFSAQLGSVDGFLDGAGEETDFTVPLWLAVTVEGEALSPRIAVNSVAYSFSSRSIESFASEAAAETDAANFGGRMYYNTTDGNLYVYDSVGAAWVDTTGAGGADDLDEAYDNFGAVAATVTVDNAQGQGNLNFRMNGADLVMTDSLAETFVTFGDDGITTVAKSLVANGAVTLGDNGDTVAIDSSDWDISTAGNMTGIGSITADGAVSLTSTLGVTGNTTLTGDLAVNGDDITSDGDLTITATGGQIVLADTNTLNLGGITGVAYHAISNAGGTADSVNVADDNDLFIQDDLEVDGTSVFDGNVDLNGTVTVNAVTTFNASPVFTSTITASGAIEANGGITTQNGTALTLNSGDVDAINIGSDADAESINIGTGAATKTITIGNATGATVLNVDTGTGGVDVDLLGAMSVDGELLVIGGAADGNTATGDADLYVVGDFETDGIADFDGSFDFDGTTFDVDGSGLVSLASTAASLTLDAATGIEINATGGAISIGNDADAQAINVGTGAAARTITIGNGTGATTLNMDAGSGGLDVDSVGLIALTSTQSSLALEATDTGNAGNLVVRLSAGNVSPSAGADGNDIAVEAEDDVLVEATDDFDVDAADMDVLVSGAISLDAGAASNFTVSGAADLTLSSTGGSVVTSSGEAAADAIRIFASDAAGGIDMDAGTAGIDVDAGGVMSFDGELVAIGTAADGELATGDGDLYVVGDFEADGSSRFDGTSAFNSDMDASFAGTENATFQNTTGDAAVDVLAIQLTNTDSTAATQRGLVIQNVSNAAVTTTEALLALDNADADTLTDGLILTATGNVTDALDVSATAIVNAVNVGSNIILGTDAAIDFSEFDVASATGSVTINDDGNLGSLTVEGTQLDIDSLAFIAGGALSTGSGTSLLLTGGDNGTDAGEDVIVDSENWNVSGSGLIDTNGGLNVSAGDISLTDNSGASWSITNTGVAQLGASVTIAGAADGTDALVLTQGDILLTDGDFTMNGGDFDVQLDASDTAAIANPAAITSNASFAVNHVTDAANAGNSAGLGVNATFSEYVDDGATDHRQALSVTVTNNATDGTGPGLGDTVSGVRVQNLAGSNDPNGSEFAIRLGTNWDADLSLGNLETISNQTDDTIVFSGAGGTNNASLAVDLDGAVNAIPTLATGAASHLAVNSSISVGLDGSTAENVTNAGFAFGGGNDLYVEDMLGVNGNVYADGVVTLQGAADGTDALVLTTGDILVSDGDLTLNGGDFDAVLDSMDSASVSNPSVSSAAYAFGVSSVTAGAYAGNVTGTNISMSLTNYADDGDADTREALSIDVTNNATDAGTDDTILGLRIKSLTGGNNPDGSEFAIAIDTGWDAELRLANNETVGNGIDDTVVFGGMGGTNNTSFTIDLDGNVTTVPTIVGDGVTNLVAINDGLSVGVDGDTAENVTSSGFSMSGGDDLYVEDDLGIDGDAYFDGTVSFGIEQNLSGATPDVSAGNYYRLTQGAPTTLTNFVNGRDGQVIFLRIGDNNTTFDCTGANLNCGTTDIVAAGNDFVTFFRNGPGNWELLSYMDSSDNQNAGNGFDLAEWFPTSEELGAGDVVAVDPSGDELVHKSQVAYDATAIGVVTTAPGLVLGEPATAFASQIALAGRVPVNVTNENGDIQPGDYLAASSTPGYAMKATEAGSVIGVAMGSSSGATGQVIAKIANFWYAPPATQASSLQGSDGSVLAAVNLSADSVVVAGNALFEGSVSVEGHLYAGTDTAGRARIVSGDTRVHVLFEEEYAYQPIVTATLRTATDIPGYWWVEGESTTGFYIVLDGTLGYDVEFNWIALGVRDGRVSVSDGSVREISVYVMDGGSAPELVIPATEAPAVTDEEAVAAEPEADVSSDPAEEGDPGTVEVGPADAESPEEPAADAQVVEEPAVTEDLVPVEEPAIEEVPAEEPVPSEEPAI